MGWIPRPVRRAIVLVLGGTLLLLAIIGIILPVIPGFIFVPFAFAIMAAEFAWAARWLRKIKRSASGVQARVKRGWTDRKRPAPVIINQAERNQAQ